MVIFFIYIFLNILVCSFKKICTEYHLINTSLDKDLLLKRWKPIIKRNYTMVQLKFIHHKAWNM